MKKTLLPVALIVLCGLVGCLPTSINPLYTDKDLVFDPALVGVWRDKDDPKGTWTFEKAGEKSYKFVYAESDGKVGQFDARLKEDRGRAIPRLFSGRVGHRGNEPQRLL